jgi:hypothetical protein
MPFGDDSSMASVRSLLRLALAIPPQRKDMRGSGLIAANTESMHTQPRTGARRCWFE